MGTLTKWLVCGLREADFRTVVKKAWRVMVALGAMRTKTDRNDARGIAQNLRSGWCRDVHVKSLESHYIRMLMARRARPLRNCLGARGFRPGNNRYRIAGR